MNYSGSIEDDSKVQKALLESTNLQILLEKTTLRIKELNLNAQKNEHQIALLDEKLKTHQQFRIAKKDFLDLFSHDTKQKSQYNIT